MLISSRFGYERRLHHPWQYRRFFDKNEVIRLSECVIFRMPNDLNHFRLGITLKARGRSVDRNRAKRTIREAFRTQSDILGAYDYNVVLPASRKLAPPYLTRLDACLRKELRRGLTTR